MLENQDSFFGPGGMPAVGDAEAAATGAGVAGTLAGVAAAAIVDVVCDVAIAGFRPDNAEPSSGEAAGVGETAGESPCGGN